MIASILGDSNFRDLYTSYKDSFNRNLEMDTNFEYVTSVVSMRTVLERPNFGSNVVFVGFPTNEISQKSKNNTKSREGIIEAVVSDFFDCINKFADAHGNVLIVVCYPLLRLEPPWLENKFDFCKDTLRKALNISNHSNVHLGSDFETTQEDLKPDRIHLNKEGMKKVSEILLADLKTASSELKRMRDGEDGDQMEEDSPDSASDKSTSSVVARVSPPASQRSLRKTPARNKRHFTEVDTDTRGTKKKRTSDAKIDTVLDKLELFMKELREDRRTNDARFNEVEKKIDSTITSQEELKEEVKKIKESDNCFSASLREDLDAMENVNARDTVIVKKLKMDTPCPTDKKDLATKVMEAGKEILTLIMGDTTAMKYIAPLYFKNERRPPREGERNELPPFKITFKHVSEAINFKEKAIAASKLPDNRLYKAYFAHQQNVGTRIRLMLMWSVADNLKKDGKESWVSQSSPKPSLMVRHSGQQVKTYSYIEAMTSFEEKIGSKALEEATKLARKFFYGQVEKIFIVLKDCSI
jgi:hypothetical protein